MSGGRPRTAIGTYGEILVTPTARGFCAFARFRDLDGRLRPVQATARSQRAAVSLLKERMISRPGYGSGGLLRLSSPFGDLCELWLQDLEGQDLSEGTKENYRDDLRLHVRPVFESYQLGEISTGRVEWFLKTERAVSYSRAPVHSRCVCCSGRSGNSRCSPAGMRWLSATPRLRQLSPSEAGSTPTSSAPCATFPADGATASIQSRTARSPPTKSHGRRP